MIKRNEQHILSLLRNQTSILNSTINIIKQNKVNTAEERTHFSHEIVAQVHGVEENAQYERLFGTFVKLSRRSTLTLSNISPTHPRSHNRGSSQKNHSSFADTAAIQGRIIPRVPPSMQVPVCHGNRLSLYNLISVQPGITERHGIFKLNIPLIGSDVLNLHQLMPTTYQLNDTSGAVKLSTDLLAVNLHQDRYFSKSKTKLEKCTLLGKHNFLCPITYPIYNKGASQYTCEINFFNEVIRPNCSFQTCQGESWVYLNNSNQ